MTAKWTDYLAKPSSFYPLIENLRQLVKSNKEIDVQSLHSALRWQHGNHYYEILDATNGTQRYLGLAAKHIKISKVHYDDNIILFHDPVLPFYKDSDNEAYGTSTSVHGRSSEA